MLGTAKVVLNLDDRLESWGSPSELEQVTHFIVSITQFDTLGMACQALARVARR